MVFYCEQAAGFCSDIYTEDQGYFNALLRMFEQALKFASVRTGVSVTLRYVPPYNTHQTGPRTTSDTRGSGNDWPLRLERHGRALCAVCLDRDIAQTFGNAQSWFLHCVIFRSFDQENN